MTCLFVCYTFYPPSQENIFNSLPVLDSIYSPVSSSECSSKEILAAFACFLLFMETLICLFHMF